MGFSRLPNGLGNVSKLSGNRRKPYRARKTIGYNYDDENKTAKQVYVTIGYYSTKKEAIEALAKYSNVNISIFGAKAKFEDVFMLVCEEEPEDRYEKVYKNYRTLFGNLMNKTFCNVQEDDYYRFFNTLARTQKVKLLTFIRKMYDVAKRKGIYDKCVIDNVKVQMDNTTKIVRIPFNKREIESFYEHDEMARDLAIIGVYTGLREAEIFDIKKKNVHLEDRYIICGMKTDAGKNRRVPIHHAIEDLVARLMEEDDTEYLIGKGNITLCRSRLRYFFDKYYNGHTSHDMRVTFATNAYNSKIDDAIVKKIMGHKTNDITIDVYTKITTKQIVDAIDQYTLF